MLSETEMLKVCRARVGQLENALSDIQDQLVNVVDLKMANAMWVRIQDTLREDFLQAVITSADMTDEQRAYWLDKPEKENPPG